MFHEFLDFLIGHWTAPFEDILSEQKEGDNGMPAKWTADLLGEMHLAGVTAKQLAAEVGWNPKYLSAVLNGHKEPKGAEEKLKAALGRLISEQSQRTATSVQ